MYLLRLCGRELICVIPGLILKLFIVQLYRIILINILYDKRISQQGQEQTSALPMTRTKFGLARYILLIFLNIILHVHQVHDCFDAGKHLLLFDLSKHYLRNKEKNQILRVMVQKKYV